MDNLLPDLMETGTRYQHYMELVDIFNTGIEIIKGLNTRATVGDNQKRIELEHAVTRIESRMDVLSKYQIKQSAIRKVVEFELPKLPKEPQEPLEENSCRV